MTYASKREAYRNKLSNEKVVKVEGGYRLMDAGYYYQVWLRQK